MDGNSANGGLILKTQGKLFISDARGDVGTFMLDASTGSAYRASGSFWFMNAHGVDIYCSDRQRGGALVKLDAGTLTAETILDAPCYGIAYSGGWLIYIDERDGMLYRCRTDGSGNVRLADERAVCFAAAGGNVFFATDKGIWTCGSGGGKAVRIAECAAAHMILFGDKLAYADRERNYALTILDPACGDIVRLDELAPAGLNTDGRYLYCANRRNGRTVYRVDPEQGRNIRICGERADYLHVIGDELYFYGRNDWYTMSLHGGQPLKVVTQRRGGV
ncbi:DUF5050 domain-containing protein [Paenibacillus alkalitolerans]|uniref:DUF5050 domain-containing protein n=1 Tax=Paenibacillus alkalitolerans TaxID=2799335 RepID=UPI0018F4FD83|nr:DUF5050 domain-containing protein [Paenibacillus alkalitolerans]